MLKLTNIVKEYRSGPTTVHALRNITIAFRPSEFVAILGQSGCGKTTLLNIIGGLDRYTSGDMCIRGKSTSRFKSRDWDTYRNHSVGFVFQSYNLIPHQTVLANVELALTLSGVRRAERRRRAIAALTQVGLADQMHKKPNQMSGGQMQRVAIARALVNDPEILLADEPTGALDSETSVQVMEILKQVAKDRLVIMVTHNPELAQAYATRIVRLKDGQILSDTDPYDGQSASLIPEAEKKRASMRRTTALSLSLSNLMTKKGRTILTAFAGSIGIVGIALILSLSTGINRYIADVEQDTLANYPLTLQAQSVDMSGMISAMQSGREQPEHAEGVIYSSNVMSGMMDMMFSSAASNNLSAFREYILSGESGLEALTSEIRYLYDTPLNVYRTDTAGGILQVNPSTVFSAMGMDAVTESPMSFGSSDVWQQLTDNTELLQTQYTVLSGHLPRQWNEVVLILDADNQITDYTLYALGVLDISELQQAMQEKIDGGDPELDTSVREYAYTDFIGMTFRLLPSSSLYQQEDGLWADKSQDSAYLAAQLADAPELTITGIVRPQENSTAGSAYGVIGYRGDLMTYLMDQVDQSAAVQAQRANPDTDIFTGLPFRDPDAEAVVLTMEELEARIAQLPQEQQEPLLTSIDQMRQAGMEDAAISRTLSSQLPDGYSDSTYEKNLSRLGVADRDNPSAIALYPVDFAAKDAIADVIAAYNRDRSEADQITYTDYVGLMMSSITTIINAISYILIAFVAISLVVSSIMIGIITNISVLERTKEIGILRAVGASKRDISRVFNAETLLEGFAAGLVGIGLTELLILPCNALIANIAGIDAKAFLSPAAAVILVAISMGLTFLAGLIPAHSAANKDPVVALRSE